MGLVERVNEEMKEALKAKQAERLSALRNIRAAFLYEMKKDGATTLADEPAIGVLRKLEKQRQESIEAFAKGGREEMAAAERAELAVLQAFLPSLADEATTARWVDEAIAASGAASAKEIGKVMGALMKAHKGEMDGNLARAIEAWVVAALGAQAFLAAVLTVVALATAFAWRTFARLGPRPRAAIALGVAIYAGTAWRLRGNAVEAVHVVEYGALGVLALRALAHGGRDALLAPAAALLAASVGCLDELIQWLIPQRVGDLRDIGVNAITAAGAPALLALGVRPAWARARPSRRSQRRLLAMLALAWGLLGAACLNTSARIAWLARNVPGLAALASQETGIVDYGVLHELPGVGSFPSRLSRADWEGSDRERARRAGALLAANVRAAKEANDDAPSPYDAFLVEHSAVRDPLLHELRVHLFRRDRYVETADSHADDPPWRARDMTVAVRENSFLERFAPATLRAGSLAWTDAERAEREALDNGTPYTSRAAEAVVTRVRERDVALAWVLGAAALAIARARLRT